MLLETKCTFLQLPLFSSQTSCSFHCLTHLMHDHTESNPNPVPSFHDRRTYHFLLLQVSFSLCQPCSHSWLCAVPVPFLFQYMTEVLWDCRYCFACLGLGRGLALARGGVQKVWTQRVSCSGNETDRGMLLSSQCNLAIFMT